MVEPPGCPAMNSQATLHVVPAEWHDGRVRSAFTRRGYQPDEVEGMVRLGREAARHGIRTHNAIKALHLDDLFGSKVGGCVPGARVDDLSGRFAAARVWDAHRKPGPSVAYSAMETCLDLADRFGVGMVSVDQAWHYLWGGAYVLEAARKGFIGYTQCTAMLAEVVPFGGARAALGTNPHSWAFPTTEVVGFPILVDFATSAVAMGRIQQHAREGKPLQPGWAVDGTGRETLDPAQVAALLPFGGHKGYGLGLLNELFAGMTGAFLPSERGRFGRGLSVKRTPAFHFMAIHPEALAGNRPAGEGSWQDRVRAIVRDILGGGNETAILPGAPEAAMARATEAAGGLLFTEAELDAFDAIGADLGESAWDRSTLPRVPAPR